MNVARPAGGFQIVVKKSVKEYLEAEAVDNCRVTQLWSDILDRINITALKEGTRIKSEKGRLRFTFIADGAADFKIPTIQIVCECAGDTLTVIGALVWNESDHDDDEEDDS